MCRKGLRESLSDVPGGRPFISQLNRRSLSLQLYQAAHPAHELQVLLERCVVKFVPLAGLDGKKRLAHKSPLAPSADRMSSGFCHEDKRILIIKPRQPALTR